MVTLYGWHVSSLQESGACIICVLPDKPEMQVGDMLTTSIEGVEQETEMVVSSRQNIAGSGWLYVLKLAPKPTEFVELMSGQDWPSMALLLGERKITVAKRYGLIGVHRAVDFSCTGFSEWYNGVSTCLMMHEVMPAVNACDRLLTASDVVRTIKEGIASIRNS